LIVSPDLISPALKIAGFWSLWLLLWLPFAVPMALKLGWRPFQPSQPAQKLPLLATLYLLAPLALWIVDGSWPALTPKFWMTGVIGLLVGSFSLIALYGLQLWAGWLRLADRLTLKPAAGLLILGLALGVGWTEELIFRGFMQDQLEQGLSVWGAAALVSLIFAMAHALWEGRTVLPQLPGLWLMGMVLVLARQGDAGSLGLAWGLHSGWVWAIGSLDAAQPSSSGRLPVWVTGFNDSPLAGLIGLLFLLATAGGLWVLLGR
jgi:hypothetical protein